MPAPNPFTTCRCPRCKASLSQVLESTPTCPTCNQPLDPHDVWLTQRSPGEIVLAPWLRAFDWHFLLMLAGATVIALRYADIWMIPYRGWIMLAAKISFALGFVRFLYQLAMRGEG